MRGCLRVLMYCVFILYVLSFYNFRHCRLLFLVIPYEISRHQPVVKLVSIYSLCLRNVNSEGMLARCDSFKLHLFRHNIAARTPVGT